MCLAIPGRIVALHPGSAESPEGAGSPESPGSPAGAASSEDADLWRTATVDFGGVLQPVSLACLPEARLGDRVLVHVGLAISLVEVEVEP